MPLSESSTLRRISTLIAEAERMVDEGDRSDVFRYLAEAQELVQRLAQQAQMGYHANPAMVIYGNPPAQLTKAGRFSRDIKGPMTLKGIISHEAHAILYRHVKDGKPYRHDFEHPTTLLAVERNGQNDVVITSPDGNPVWQDF